VGIGNFNLLWSEDRKTLKIGLNQSLIYMDADTFLARPTYLSIVFSVQGTGGSPTESRVGDQDTGGPGRPVSSGLQVLGEPFPSWSG
jgi:hypothetical protein